MSIEQKIAKYFALVKIKEEDIVKSYQTGLVVARRKQLGNIGLQPPDVLVLTFVEEDNSAPDLEIAFNYGYFTKYSSVHSYEYEIDSEVLMKKIKTRLLRLTFGNEGPIDLHQYEPFKHFPAFSTSYSTTEAYMMHLITFQYIKITKIEINASRQEFSYEPDASKSEGISSGMGRPVDIKPLLSAFIFNSEGEIMGLVVEINAPDGTTTQFTLKYHRLPVWGAMSSQLL